MWRPPLSTKSYISLDTTSVEAPSRWKTPRSSNIGGITSPYPAASTMSANTSTSRRNRAESGARMSRVPGDVWKADMVRRE